MSIEMVDLRDKPSENLSYAIFCSTHDSIGPFATFDDAGSYLHNIVEQISTCRGEHHVISMLAPSHKT